MDGSICKYILTAIFLGSGWTGIFGDASGWLTACVKDLQSLHSFLVGQVSLEVHSLYLFLFFVLKKNKRT